MEKKNQVTINGETHFLESGCTLDVVLKQLGLEADRVAIELNRAIVRRNCWDTTAIDAGAEIEIVQFVGGG